MDRAVKKKTKERVRLVDVARAAKVARSTAAQALTGSGGANVRVSEQVARRIRRIAAEMNYRPNSLARGLKGSPTTSVGAVWDFVDPWCGDAGIANAILHRLQGQGFATYQANHPHTVEKTCEVLEDLQSRRLDALIIRWRHDQYQNQEIRHRLESFPGTIAVVHWAVSDLAIDQLVHDRDAAIRSVVDHFALTGRRKLAIVLNMEDVANQHKFEVFRRRCREHGLPDHERMCIDLNVPRWPRIEAYEHILARTFPRLDQPLGVDAIFCINDVGAMTFARTFKKHGIRIPDDVALVGLNDPEAMRLWDPPLASIDRQQDQVVTMLNNMLNDRMNDPDIPPQQKVVPMQFVWRESAGGVRKASVADTDIESKR